MELYNYRATIIKVHDGDTVTARIDLGFDVSVTETFRLARINAPEVVGASKTRGLESRDYLRQQLLNCLVDLTTQKDRREKYGRYLAEIYYLGSTTNVNDEMVSKGFAEYQDY